MIITPDNLFLKIEKGENKEVIEYLKKAGIDTVDEFGRSPLMNASFYNNYELVAWLLENGASVDLQDKNGFSALHFAAQEASLESAKLLLENNANQNIIDIHGNTPSWVIIMNWKAGKNFDLLKELISYNANLEITNNAGKTTREIIPDAIMAKLIS